MDNLIIEFLIFQLNCYLNVKIYKNTSIFTIHTQKIHLTALTWAGLINIYCYVLEIMVSNSTIFIFWASAIMIPKIMLYELSGCGDFSGEWIEGLNICV